MSWFKVYGFRAPPPPIFFLWPHNDIPPPQKCASNKAMEGVASPPPNLLFLAFWVFLAFFLLKEFLAILSVFPFNPKQWFGKQKKSLLVWRLSLLFSKKARKIRVPLGTKLLHTVFFRVKLFCLQLELFHLQLGFSAYSCFCLASALTVRAFRAYGGKISGFFAYSWKLLFGFFAYSPKLCWASAPTVRNWVSASALAVQLQFPDGVAGVVFFGGVRLGVFFGVRSPGGQAERGALHGGVRGARVGVQCTLGIPGARVGAQCTLGIPGSRVGRSAVHFRNPAGIRTGELPVETLIEGHPYHWTTRPSKILILWFALVDERTIFRAGGVCLRLELLLTFLWYCR